MPPGHSSHSRPIGAGVARAVCVFIASIPVLAVLATVRHAPLTGDEALILSLSASLAEEGYLGTPILEGLHGADRRYFLSLPALHFAHWPLLRIAEPSYALLRITSLAFAAVLLAAAGWVVYRKAGLRGLAVALALLVFWRTGIIGSSHGLTLIGAGRSLRYDAMVAGLMALTIPLSEAWLRSGRPRFEVMLGSVVGLSALTHFPAWVLPLAVVGSWAVADRSRPAFRSVVRVVLVAGILVVPYAAWVASNRAIARAQVAAVHGAAGRLESGPGAIVSNILSEPDRYVALAAQPGLGPPLFMVALLGVALYSLIRLTRFELTYRVAAVHLLVYLTVLAMFESTKASIYVLPALVPTMVLVSAVLSRTVSSRARALAGIGILALALEGVAATVYDMRAIRGLVAYDRIVEAIRSPLAPGERWIGAIRWAWGFRDEAYAALPYLDLRTRNSADRAAAFRSAWDRFGPTVILDTPEWRDDVARLPAGASAFVTTIMTNCATPVLSLEDDAYGPVTVLSIENPCAEVPGSAAGGAVDSVEPVR